MKAAIIRRFGGPEELQITDVPTPTPGPNQVLVKVVAASVNPVDTKIRAHGSWAGIPMPAILGYDAAGTVEAVGPGVTAFRPGDDVFYSAKIFGRQGTYAEYHVEDAEVVHAKPAGLSFEEAAALPLAGCTAYDGVVGFFRLRPAETVLIHAGAGGVGSLAVQLARASGARVLATCRSENFELVKGLGADVTIDYRKRRFEDAVLEATGGAAVDAVYDTVGADTLARSIQIVRPYGKLASIVNVAGDLNAAYGKNLIFYFGFMERAQAKMHALAVMVERGQLRPLIDRVLPLEQIADAHRKVEAGGARGKVVIRI